MVNKTKEAGFVLILVFLLGSCVNLDENRFDNDELHGLITKIKDIGRGKIHIEIISAGKNYNYSLFLKSDLEDSDIIVGDSISKKKNDSLIFFFRKENGKYKEIARVEF